MVRGFLTQRSRAAGGDGKFKGMVLGVFIVCLIATSAQAKYSGGTGEPNSPFLISTAADMNAIGTDSNDWDKHFLMTADIDLSGFTGEQFNIIGNYTNPFTGVFDGNGHTIWNLNLEVDKSEVGLFGCIGGIGVVQNVCLEGIDIKAVHYVGGISGRNEGVIQNCHVSGIVEGEQDCGGITGACFCFPFGPQSQIRNCSFKGQVRGTWATGGIVGSTDMPEIIKCFAIAEIIGDVQCGGIVGRNMGGNLTMCFAKGDVICSYGAGGFAGITSDHCHYGGHIRDCYADVTVDCNQLAGGFSGSAPGYDGQIWNCYCSGRVVYDANNHTEVGGFIGEERTLEGVFCSYFLETTGPNNGFGEPLSEEQMKKKESFAGWDFLSETINGPNDVWRMCVDDVNYPRLTWEFDKYGDFVCPDGVDGFDLEVLSEQWLKEGFSAEVDFYSDEAIDFLDWDVFAATWDSNSLSANWDPNCDVAPVGGDGVIDGGDMAVFLHHWLQDSSLVLRADIAPAGGDYIVNMKDFAILAENWLAGL